MCYNLKWYIFEEIFFLIFIFFNLSPSDLGELSRSYTRTETLKHMGNLQLAAMLFHAISPLSPVLFQWIDFKMFGMEINQYNFIGLFMIIFTILYQVISYFFLTNLTTQRGYQIFLKLEGVEDQNSSDNKVVEPVVELLSYKEIFSNIDIVLILIGVSIAGFMCPQFEICTNIMAVMNFSWSINYLSFISIISITMAAFFMKILARLNSEIDVNYQSVILLIIYGFLINLMSLPLVFKLYNKSLQVSFVMASLNLYLVAGYNIRVFSSGLLFMIVPTHSRCYIIGIRQVIYKISMAVGYFTASFNFKYGSIVYPILATLCLTISIIRLLRSPGFLKKYL